MTYKETDFTSYNSYTVKDKQKKLGVWTDVGWEYLVSGLVDRFL